MFNMLRASSSVHRIPLRSIRSFRLKRTVSNPTSHDSWSRLKSKTVFDGCRERVLQGFFYRAPCPFVALRSLDECFLVEDYFASNALELYVFARVSQVYAEARKLFSRLSPIVNGENATVLDSILNPQRNLRNSVLPSVIQNAEDLDAYWAEFGVTGLCDCILRIVDVLDWPDIGRSILELAINGRGSLRLQSCDWQSLVDAGIARRNSDGFQLNRIGDTDILLCDALRSGNIGAKSVFEQLSLEKSNYMATKSAAFWSLKSNSQFDDIVRECCTLAASKPGGDSRKLLFDQSRDNES